MPETPKARTEAAARKAEELGVDIEQVVGTGADGGVTVDDVKRAAEARRTSPGETETEQQQTPAEAEEEMVLLVPNPKLDVSLVHVEGQDFRREPDVFQREAQMRTRSEYEQLKEHKTGGLQFLVKEDS